MGSVWSWKLNSDAMDSEGFLLSLRFPPNITVATVTDLCERAVV